MICVCVVYLVQSKVRSHIDHSRVIRIRAVKSAVVLDPVVTPTLLRTH